MSFTSFEKRSRTSGGMLRRRRAGCPFGAKARSAVIEVDDDGRGFDREHTSSGLGMGNLAERAEAIGGTLAVDSALGRGTTVRVTVPL